MNVVELNQRISVLYSAFILKLKNKNVKETKFWFDFSKKKLECQFGYQLHCSLIKFID